MKGFCPQFLAPLISVVGYKLPFILLSDFDKKIRIQFGVPNDFLGLIPGRATYVIDKKGVVQLIFDSTSAKIHIEKALEILKTM